MANASIRQAFPLFMFVRVVLGDWWAFRPIAGLPTDNQADRFLNTIA
jgi:hypothetical protein